MLSLPFITPQLVRDRLFVWITIAALVATIIGCLLNTWFSSILLFCIFMLSVHIILRSFIDKPLQALLALTRKEGDFAAIPQDLPEGGDEFARLARAIYALGFRLQNSLIEAREETTKLTEIFSAIGDGLILASHDGKLIKINNTVRRWLGYYGDVSNQRLVDVVRSTELAERLNKMAGELRADSTTLPPPEVMEELPIQGPDERIVRAKIVLVQLTTPQPGFLIFLFDVTDLHRAQELRRDFFANASHELKTPIAAIRGYAETLAFLPAVQDNHTARNFLGVISRNADELGKKIDEMLTLAEVESGNLTLQFESCHVPRVLERIFELMKPKADDAKVALLVDIAPDVTEIVADPQRFDSVIINLIDNGIKYNRDGGLVKVSVRQDAKDLYLYVEDNGIGMAEVDARRAFERFYRADKAHTRLGGGSGLGLAIVKHIVQAHGGSISLRSEMGTGTVFTVRFPRRAANKKTETLKPW